MNREAWLNRLAEMLRPWFRDAGYPIKGRMSISMAALNRSTLGNCRPTYDENGQKHHIFITAYEDGQMSDPVEVGCVLVHEILHPVMPLGTGHGAAFQRAMKPLDLIGKATATMGGAKLRAHVTELLRHLPLLPRHGVNAPPPRMPRGGGNSGMIQFQCPCCRISVFLKYTSLKRAGAPICWNSDCEERPLMDEATVTPFHMAA
jgi:hypothetical protein